jgi:hypothetical protein
MRRQVFTTILMLLQIIINQAQYIVVNDENFDENSYSNKTDTEICLKLIWIVAVFVAF